MLNLQRVLGIAAALGLTCCGTEADPAGGPSAGAGGQTTGGNPTSPSAGSGGAPAGAGQGGSSSPAAGSGGGQSVAGAGGAQGGASAAGGAAGAGGSSTGGSGGSGGGAATPLWECPPGPFPTPVVGQIDQLCMGFDFAFNYLEGPTWVKADSALYFTNFNIGQAAPGDIIKHTLGGACEVFKTNVGCNGLAVGLNGTLLGACQQSRSVESFNLSTKVAMTLASMHMDKLLDSPNDLVVRSNGAVYFTNRTAELGGRPVGFGPAIFWIDPAGVLSMIEKGDGNGIALSPDERTLYVNNLANWQLDENGVPGQKLPQSVSGDGLAVDCAGNLYQSGGQIKNAQGQNIGNFPGGTNMAFGGPDGKLLFVVSGGANVRALHMNVPGIP